MDKAIINFQIYLKELFEANELKLQEKNVSNKRDIKRQQMEIERLLNDIVLFDKGFSKTFDYLLFNDYSLLSKYLELSNIKTKDLFTIMSFAIKFNTRPLTKDAHKQFLSAIGIDYSFRNRDELNQKLDTWNKELERNDKKLSKKEKKERAKQVVNIMKHKLYIGIFVKVKQLKSNSELVDCCYRFSDLVLLNPYYNQDDIAKARSILQKLFVSESIITEMSDFLNYNIKEEVQESEDIEIKIEVEESNTETAEYESIKDIKESRKNYHELMKQVLVYYDPENKEFIKPIPYEQIINMVALLYSLGYQDEDVCSFLKKSKGTINGNKQVRSYSNLTLDYIHISLGEKFKYYAESIESIKPHIENFDIYFDELKKCKNKKDYNSWRDIWVEEINTINSIIGSRYDYEITKAKTLLKVMETEY
ncbi:MAG: hypothetical protein J1F35_03215 [Erysipelotrichales bacterium]|nr:hypothetical protein [Erysipelotrichales bacterium]